MTDRSEQDYKACFHIYYDGVENVFYDSCGKRIINILEILTPNDLFLFRSNQENCVFAMRDDWQVSCKIVIENRIDPG